MKKTQTIALLFLLATAVLFASCSRNYYSGTGKKGKGCGCPSTKGMVGY